jgi:hypothetical protein
VESEDLASEIVGFFSIGAPVLWAPDCAKTGVAITSAISAAMLIYSSTYRPDPTI